MVNAFCANIQLFFSDSMDSSHLETRGSMSQVIEQLPQPNRKSRYISVWRNLFKCINGSVLLSVPVVLP